MSHKNDVSSTLDKILERKAEQERKEAIIAEEVADYKAVLERICSSPDGQFIMKKLIRYCGVFSFDHKIDGGKLVEDAGKRKVFLELFYPYLSKPTLTKILEN